MKILKWIRDCELDQFDEVRSRAPLNDRGSIYTTMQITPLLAKELSINPPDEEMLTVYTIWDAVTARRKRSLVIWRRGTDDENVLAQLPIE